MNENGIVLYWLCRACWRGYTGDNLALWTTWTRRVRPPQTGVDRDLHHGQWRQLAEAPRCCDGSSQEMTTSSDGVLQPGRLRRRRRRGQPVFSIPSPSSSKWRNFSNFVQQSIVISSTLNIKPTFSLSLSIHSHLSHAEVCLLVVTVVLVSAAD